MLEEAIRMKEKKKSIRRWAVYNIYGFEVTISRNVSGDSEWFCSYVTIPGSKVLKDEWLNCPTFRENDEFGYDTAHAYNDKQTLAEKLDDAILQVQHGIEQALKVLEIASN